MTGETGLRKGDGRQGGAGRRIGPALLVAALALGCGGEPAPGTDGRDAEVARAESAWDAAAFDTVTWNRAVARSDRGRAVYYYSCSKCHGPEGEGQGSRARRDELEVPSIVAPDWAYDGRIDSIRRAVFVGHRSGMPSWGLTDLSLRDLDAVAYYVDDLLPEERVDEPTSGDGS